MHGSKVMATQGHNILSFPAACKVTGHLEGMANLLQENPTRKEVMAPLTTLSGACLAVEQLSSQPPLQAQGDTGRRQLPRPALIVPKLWGSPVH